MAGVMISVRTLAAALGILRNCLIELLRAMCLDNITAVAATDYKCVDRLS